MTSIIPQSSGIYIIKNLKNGKFYIGQAQNLRHRWHTHCSKLRKDKHANPYLQRAWNKYGEDAFKFLILEYCSMDVLYEREQHYLDLYAKGDNCYNIALDAQAPMRGKVLSDETRRRMGEARRGNKNPNFGKPSPMRGKPAANRGKKLSDETRMRMSEARRGKKRKPFNEETLRKMSEIKRGENHPNFGKHHSDETKRKMREAQLGEKGHNFGKPSLNRGKTMSTEARARMSEAQKNRPPITDETRRKLSEAAKNISDETHHKLSEGHKKRYIVTSPDGVEFDIVGLKQFCQENNLSSGAMCEVAQGKYPQHKGWKVRYV